MTVPERIEERLKEETWEALDEAEEIAIGNTEVLKRITAGREPLQFEHTLQQALDAHHKNDDEHAIYLFRKTLSLRPDDATAHNWLAELLATSSRRSLRNGKEPVIHATRACERMQWKYAQYFEALAAAYAQAEQFDEAAKWQSKFLEDPGLSDSDKQEGRRRLALYQSRQSYQAPAGTGMKQTEPDEDDE